MSAIPASAPEPRQDPDDDRERRLNEVIAGYIEDLEAGDSLLFNAGVPHVYENLGDEEARCHDLIMYPAR